MINYNFNLVVDSEYFLDYIKKSPMGYILINEEGLIITANLIFLKASKFKEQDILNKSYNEIIVYEGKKEDFLRILNSYAPNKELSLPWIDKKGIIHYSKVIIWKTSLKPILYAIGFEDIKHEQNEILLTSFARNFVNENNIGIIIVDNQLHITEISPLACRLLNVSKNQVINQVIDEVFAGVPDEHRIVQQTLLNGITVTNFAISWTINKEKHDLLIDSNRILNETGDILGAYVIFKDITNLRSVEQNVRQNDRLAAIGQIATGTAHEIRNPLTSIKGFLQVIRTSLEKNVMKREVKYTDVMMTEIEKINKLVDQILLLSKPKNLDYKPINIDSILKEIIPIIKTNIDLNNVNVEYKANGAFPLIIADEQLLKQAFLNIAKNGIEAMGGRGTLTITTRINIENKNLEILFHDTGPGIPNYIADKIFEPFFTTKEYNVGLGLSISQKIIYDLGGTIRVSTKGFGTTFQVIIPFI